MKVAISSCNGTYFREHPGNDRPGNDKVQRVRDALGNRTFSYRFLFLGRNSIREGRRTLRIAQSNHDDHHLYRKIEKHESSHA